MSAATQTKIFGVRIAVDPKILVGGLIAVALLLFWYNSRSEDETSAPAAGVSRPTAAPLPSLKPRVITRRTATPGSDRVTLRLRPIDATRGDVDPTLRLDLLNRLQFVKAEEGGRNLFEAGPPPMTEEEKKTLANAKKIVPQPPAPTQPNTNTPPPLNIPLQYYGFVKAGDKGENRRGLFLDGDNVLVASEGELLKQRYLVVELTAISARLEDVQVKQGQTLPVVPVAAQ